MLLWERQPICFWERAELLGLPRAPARRPRFVVRGSVLFVHQCLGQYCKDNGLGNCLKKGGAAVGGAAKSVYNSVKVSFYTAAVERSSLGSVLLTREDRLTGLCKPARRMRKEGGRSSMEWRQGSP
jgi:hypothetical protein